MTQRFIQEVTAWIGTPFVHQGRARGHGCDCIGLVIGAAAKLGLRVVDERAYARRPKSVLLRDKMREHLQPVSVDAMEPGDIMLFRIHKWPQHVAVLVDGGYMIHASADVGRVVKHRLDDKWRAHLDSVYRLIWSDHV